MKIQVILKGITQKGRNRIREHGSYWYKYDHVVGMRGMLYESCKTGYLKWGPGPDFEEMKCDEV